MDRLNLVIHGNGLDNDGPAHFNVTCSLLKGKALCIFNDKAAEQKEETTDSHIQCLQAITEHVFLISFEGIKTHNACLHLTSIFFWHQSSLRVPNMYLIELSLI